MPYDWTTPPATGAGELHLWPHQSLTPQGYVGFLTATAVLIALPLFVLLGSVLLWGLLPFIAMALFGVKFALDRNRAKSQVLEVLTLGPEDATLVRRDRNGERLWSCNRYWAKFGCIVVLSVFACGKDYLTSLSAGLDYLASFPNITKIVIYIELHYRVIFSGL